MAALIFVGTACLIAFLLLRPAPVWVGDIQDLPYDQRGVVTYEVESERGGGMRVAGVWVKVDCLPADPHVPDYLLGNTLEAKVVEEGRESSVRNELEEAAKDFSAARALIRAGWMPKGCSAVKALDYNGHGVEAANFQFSPKAVRVVLDSAAIKKAKEHQD